MRIMLSYQSWDKGCEDEKSISFLIWAKFSRMKPIFGMSRLHHDYVITKNSTQSDMKIGL